MYGRKLWTRDLARKYLTQVFLCVNIMQYLMNVFERTLISYNNNIIL